MGQSPIATPPCQGSQTLNSPPSGQCRAHWEIVDENDHVLSEISRGCADGHIVYP